MGVWEQVNSGNPPDNSKWWTKEKKRLEEKNVRKCCVCKREFLTAMPPDGQCVLVRAESDWHWEKTFNGTQVENRIICQEHVC